MLCNGYKFYAFDISYSFRCIVKNGFLIFSPVKARCKLTNTVKFQIILHLNLCRVSLGVYLNWLFVIMKSYCKVNFRQRNRNNNNNATALTDQQLTSLKSIHFSLCVGIITPEVFCLYL